MDLAWGEGTATRLVNETGLACINGSGEVLDAGWSRGLDDILAWIAEASAGVEDVLVARKNHGPWLRSREREGARLDAIGVWST